MQDDSEEKSLPASDKKLRDARKKGQVPQSRDLVSGVTLCAALAYLFFAWPTIWEHLDQIVRIITVPQGWAFEETLHRVARHAVISIFLILAPLVVITLGLTLLFGLLATSGPVLSLEPIKPKFDNINPAKGLKKLFSLRNVVEFAKGLMKAVILTGLFLMILQAWLQPLFDVVACGETCMGPVLVAILKPVIATAVLAFMIIGVADVPIQRWLFRRDMRMSKTEFKRESKDIEGDPLIRQELRRQRRDLVVNQAKLGITQAVLVIRGGDHLVALRYVRSDTPLPLVVAMGHGQLAAKLAGEARMHDIPVVEDDRLARALFESSRPGSYVGEEFFTPIVRYLMMVGAI